MKAIKGFWKLVWKSHACKPQHFLTVIWSTVILNWVDSKQTDPNSSRECSQHGKIVWMAYVQQSSCAPSLFKEDFILLSRFKAWLHKKGSPSSRWVYPKWLRFNGWKDRFPPGLGAKNDLLGRSGLSFWLYPLELPFLDRYTYHAWVASPLTQQFGKKHVCRASPPWICPCPKWAIKICILIEFRTMSSYY